MFKMSCSIVFVNYLILFLAVRGRHWCEDFSPVVLSWGYSLVAVRGLLTVVASRCTAQALELQWLQHMGSVVVAFALSHVGSSQIKDRTRISCIGRWILYH